MVSIDVTDSDDGCQRRYVLVGCYVNIFPLMKCFSTTASSAFVIQAEFKIFCIRNSWNFCYLMSILDSIHVFGLGGQSALCGRHHCWILVMMPINNVTAFDDGHQCRDVIGCYVNIFKLTT
jgi:hypothetical protein